LANVVDRFRYDEGDAHRDTTLTNCTLVSRQSAVLGFDLDEPCLAVLAQHDQVRDSGERSYPFQPGGLGFAPQATVRWVEDDQVRRNGPDPLDDRRLGAGLEVAITIEAKREECRDDGSCRPPVRKGELGSRRSVRWRKAEAAF
jgi:hypothetical protein